MEAAQIILGGLVGIVLLSSPVWIPMLILSRFRKPIQAWLGRRQIDAEIDYYENQKQAYRDGYERRNQR